MPIDALEHLDRFNIVNPLPTPFQSFLRLGGSPTGDHNIIANHAATEVSYSWACPAGHIALLYQLISYLEDSSAAWQVDQFGGQSALTIGIKVYLRRGAVVLGDFLDGETIKTNGDVSQHLHNIQYMDWLAATTAMSVLTRFELAGSPIFMQAGDSLVIVVKDDFTGLSKHTHKAVGRLYQIDEDGIQPPVP